MLYERWRRTASERSGELALHHRDSGRRWTFGELDAASERFSLDGSEYAFPQGHSAEFVMAVLGAWRAGKIVCPCEVGQPAPQVTKPPPFCVHLKSTSATTGTTRLVAFTAEQLAADAENIVATMGLRPDSPNLGVISMAHSYGFSNLVLPLLLHGVPLILSPSPLPAAVLRASTGFEEITLPAVPTLWRAWHEAGAIPSGVRLAISAGAPLAAGLEQEVFAARGLKIHNFYGSTECGGIAYDASEFPRRDDTFIGTALRHVDLSMGSDGCLVVRSGAVGETYWPEPSESLGGGTFKTSDLVQLDGGRVLLCGRVGDLINVAGRKVLPPSIEQPLVQHPAVDECVVFGVPERGAERGDLIVAAVVKRWAVTGEELRRFLLDRIPAWQVPRDWLFVEALTENRLGKISRTEWRRRYLDQH